jgi:hypothetical protein
MTGSAATADLAPRGSWLPSGRPAVVLVTIVATLLVAACAFILVPVAPSGAAAAQPIDSAGAAQAYVRKAHDAVCPGTTPTVVCAAAGRDWSCSWGSVEGAIVRRSPSASFAVAC